MYPIDSKLEYKDVEETVDMTQTTDWELEISLGRARLGLGALALTYILNMITSLQKTVDTTDWKLETNLGRAKLGLGC